MFTFLLDKVGDWNPQLLRELRGQLKPLKIGLAIAFSIIGQIVFVLVMMGQLSGSIAPQQLTVTTYPEIQMEYNDSNTFQVQYLTRKNPLENHPNYPTLTDYNNVVRGGDIITSVNGVPLESNSVDPYNKQSIYTKLLNQPLADNIEQLTSMRFGQSAAQSLRNQIPGDMVRLTIKRGPTSEPVEVALPRMISSTVTSRYCLPWTQFGKSHIDGFQQYCYTDVGKSYYQVNWAGWHYDSFRWLGVWSLFPLLILGTYSLINNLIKEEREGTFNFIRLSPQSAWDILLGKLLGVPALIYVAALFTLPLSLLHAWSSDMGLGLVVGFYAASAMITFLVFSMALLIGLINAGLGTVQAWLGAGAVFLIQFLSLQVSLYVDDFNDHVFAWVLMFTPFSVFALPELALHDPVLAEMKGMPIDVFNWFGLPVVPILGTLLLLLNGLLWSRWVWGALGRRFFSPTSTVLSKAQSYGLTLLVNLSAIGFIWQKGNYTSSGLEDSPALPGGYNGWMEDHILLLTVINLILWVFLAIALSPQRQAIYDWARYRHLLPSLNSATPDTTPQALPARRQSLWSELVWGEKSPVVVAIAINFLISSTCILLWSLHHLFGHESILIWLMVTAGILIACANILLICTTLMQFVFLYREKYTIPAALLIPIVLLAGLPIALGLTGFYPQLYPDAWFALFPWVSMYQLPVSFMGAIAGVLAQLTVLGGLNWFLARQIHTIGESDSKLLLTAQAEKKSLGAVQP